MIITPSACSRVSRQLRGARGEYARATKQNSKGYLASENIKRETSPQEMEEVGQMSEVYGEEGEKLYFPEGE